MIIVLITWRIKPGQEEQFRRWWCDQAILADKGGLVGEFLCQPVSANLVPFGVEDLSAAAPELAPSVPFVNVGLWKDSETFEAEVGQYFTDDQPLLSFEAIRRVRTILEPAERRLGEDRIPPLATCE